MRWLRPLSRVVLSMSNLQPAGDTVWDRNVWCQTSGCQPWLGVSPQMMGCCHWQEALCVHNAGCAHKETFLLFSSAPKHQSFAFKPPKRFAVHTGSPHPSCFLCRLLLGCSFTCFCTPWACAPWLSLSVTLHHCQLWCSPHNIGSHLLGISRHSQMQKIPKLALFYCRWLGTAAAEWAACWLTLQPQLEDTDLWPAYVLWRCSSLCAPKPHWSQGEDFFPLPHPFIFTGFAHELVGNTRWEHVLCKQFLLLPASAVQPGMRDLCSQKKSIQKRPVSLAPGS